MNFDTDENTYKRSFAEIFAEYVTAFASAGSWATILISVLFSEKYENRLYVCGFVIFGILISLMTITFLLRFVINLDTRKWKKTYIATFSICAALINASIFTYDWRTSTIKTDFQAKVIEIGIEKSERKEYDEGRYFSLESKYGLLRVYPKKFMYENIRIGSLAPIEMQIGGLGFVVVSLQ